MNTVISVEDNRQQEFKEYSLILVLSVAVYLFFIFSEDFYTSFGLATGSYVFLRLFFQIGRTIPVLEIMLVMAAAQWIIGPYIDYQTEEQHFKYKMYIDQTSYMQIAVPAFVAFVLSSTIGTSRWVVDKENIKKFIDYNPKLPFYVISLGLFCGLVHSIVPGPLRFIFFLLSNLKYIGFGLLLFTDSPYKWHLAGSAILILFLSSVVAGLFHDFILWSILLFFYVNFIIKISSLYKIALLIFSILFLFLIQSVKQDYRALTWKNKYEGNKIELFIGLIFNKLISFGDSDQQDNVQINDVNTRLNQGWIISIIFNRFPEKEQFIDGATVNTAISASLVPRFLFPDKIGGGGKDTFEALTGLTLLPGTAMGVSLMGEFYGNYGPEGTIIAFLVWGLILRFIYIKFCMIQKTHPIIFLFLPLIFLQVIKAESDMITVLNHLVKSLILLYALYYFSRKILQIRL